MSLRLWDPEDLARITISILSTAVSTSLAAVRSGGKLDREYLCGLFDTHRSYAKVFGMPWPQVVAEALSDIEELEPVIDRIQDLARAPVRRLVAEIEKELVGVPYVVTQDPVAA
jgi:hypothetical protein